MMLQVARSYARRAVQKLRPVVNNNRCVASEGPYLYRRCAGRVVQRSLTSDPLTRTAGGNGHRRMPVRVRLIDATPRDPNCPDHGSVQKSTLCALYGVRSAASQRHCCPLHGHWVCQVIVPQCMHCTLSVKSDVGSPMTASVMLHWHILCGRLQWAGGGGGFNPPSPLSGLKRWAA